MPDIWGHGHLGTWTIGDNLDIWGHFFGHLGTVPRCPHRCKKCPQLSKKMSPNVRHLGTWTIGDNLVIWGHFFGHPGTVLTVPKLSLDVHRVVKSVPRCPKKCPQMTKKVSPNVHVPRCPHPHLYYKIERDWLSDRLDQDKLLLLLLYTIDEWSWFYYGFVIKNRYTLNQFIFLYVTQLLYKVHSVQYLKYLILLQSLFK